LHPQPLWPANRQIGTRLPSGQKNRWDQPDSTAFCEPKILVFMPFSAKTVDCPKIGRSPRDFAIFEARKGRLPSKPSWLRSGIGWLPLKMGWLPLNPRRLLSASRQNLRSYRHLFWPKLREIQKIDKNQMVTGLAVIEIRLSGNRYLKL
jgi:hypothetical protein